MLGAMDKKKCQRWSCRLMSSLEDPAKLEKAGCFSGTAWISCPKGASSSKSFVGFSLLVLFGFFSWQAVGRNWPVPLLTSYCISERRPGAWAASPLITVQAGLWGLWCGFIPGVTPFFTRSPGRISGLRALQTCAGLESDEARKNFCSWRVPFQNQKTKHIYGGIFKVLLWRSPLFPTSVGKSPDMEICIKCKRALCSCTLLSLHACFNVTDW